MVRTRLGAAAVALGVMLTGVGCRAADEPTTQLRGTTWRVETTMGGEVIDSAASTITSEADGRVHVRGGCNCYFGTSTINGDQMSFSALGSTKMACADALTDQETRFFRALASAGRSTRMACC